MSKKVLTNKEILGAIQSTLNDREEWELENGCYMYNLKKQKDKIVLQIFEEEIDGVYDSLYAEFITDVSDDSVQIIKGLITDIYESTLNYKQQFARQTPSFYKRKIKSIANWTNKNKMDKVQELTKQLTERFVEDRIVLDDITNLKDIVRDLYNCLSQIDSSWKQKEIRDKLLKRCKELNIQNVGCSYIENEIIAYRHADDSTIISKARIVIDTAYCNINNSINELINQLRKVA
ncbi:hypothetical protein CBE01nite_29800 [Clostridium beijerinckii]|uniref:Uncharacterized protein n=1 Tax=Clostridium beijerinckii TaxID=1520 RepID=A0AB74VDA8_CLOBE|nr:hypothetical protein [Clostridium beijerinckii]NRZ28760.1 hypothetical protein [Clostridium beijerinckii]NYB95464.1 hypothetical protein [Clostridium beijerinckii]OOM24579.1 hypothetical protein CLBEI_20400 [Clostridium beijerinckii]QUN34438.1 hypothetical protein KEC93_21315 [Clostridium beijerinckii]SQB00608.1 Uncharacterised protein [Clostridium beijerinckii]